MEHKPYRSIFVELEAIVMCLIVLCTGASLGLAAFSLASYSYQPISVPLAENIYMYNGAATVSTVAQNVNTVGGIVPCSDPVDATQPNNQNACDLRAFIKLIQNLTNALFLISVPIATVAFAYVGFTLLTSQGNIGKIKDAKHTAMNVLIGFVVILTAWLLVYTITHALLDPSFNSFLEP